MLSQPHTLTYYFQRLQVSPHFIVGDITGDGKEDYILVGVTPLGDIHLSLGMAIFWIDRY